MKSKGRVQWKPGETQVRARRPHPYVNAPREYPEELQRHLVPGSLWTVGIALFLEQTDGVYDSHELPYILPPSWGMGPGVPTAAAGSLAVYVGELRVEEVDRHGNMLRIPRHTFLVGGGRYLVADLNHMQPVV